MSLTVLGSPLSPFVRKVRVVLLEKGMEYVLDPVRTSAPPEGFRKLSPLGKIPVLRDGDKTLPDSSVICAYLERRFPRPPLYGQDSYGQDDYAYARSLWFEEFADSGLFPAVGPGIYMALVGAPRMGKPPNTELAQKMLTEILPPLFDYLEGEIGARPFLVGGAFGIADISVASQFVNLRHADVQADAARWPQLAAYVERLHARPSFAALIAEEEKILAQS